LLVTGRLSLAVLAVYFVNGSYFVRYQSCPST
jgi:hypothetical protein